MSKSFTTTELDALATAFAHWRWEADSEEPDARVTVLYDEADAGVARWLVRKGDGWAWSNPHGDPADADPWEAIQRFLSRTGRVLRIPDRTELEAGGWVIEDASNHETPAEPRDEAKAQIDAGLHALGMTGFRSDNVQTLKAQAHFFGSIAISLHELVALHKKYDFDNMSITVDPGPEKEQEKTVEPSLEELKEQLEAVKDRIRGGPVAGEDFPYAR